MRAITLYNILWTTIVTWLIFLGASVFLNPLVVFNFITPILMAESVIIVIIYFDGVIDAWRTRFEDVTAAHLLTFGIVLVWLGIIVRMSRWYLTKREFAGGYEEYFLNNFGLWFTVWSGLLFLGVPILKYTTTKRRIMLGGILLAVTSFFWWLGFLNISII